MNFNLVVDTSNFKPFTFLEKIAPLLLYKDAYDKQLEKIEKYSELLSDVSPTMFRDLENKDAIQGFWDAFRDASDSFSRGMNPDNIAALNKLFIEGKAGMKRYQNAIKLRNEALKLKLQGGEDYVYNSTFAADDFLDRKDANLMWISKENTFKRGALVGAGILNTLRTPDAIKLVGDIKDGYLKYSEDNPDALKALLAALTSTYEGLSEDEKKTFDVIQLGLDLIITDTGVLDSKNGFSKEAQKQVADAALQGMLAGCSNRVNLIGDRRIDVAKEFDINNITVDENGNVSIHGYNPKEGSLGWYMKRQANDAHLGHTDSHAAHVRSMSRSSSGGSSSSNSSSGSHQSGNSSNSGGSSRGTGSNGSGGGQRRPTPGDDE